jgi:hypothetical protein
MEKTKHTPGPWTVDGDEIMANDWKIIAQMRNVINPQDAYLIASAPDLLTELKKVLPLIPVGNLRDSILSAIAKAEGKED